MDIYSYGMIGYEIITRKRVYSDCQVPRDALMLLIVVQGQKPNMEYVGRVGNTLAGNSSDTAIFDKLKDLVFRCWQTDVENRTSMIHAKNELDQLAQNEKIYDKATNNAVKDLINCRKLKSELPVLVPSGTTAAIKRWIKLSEKIQWYILTFFILFLAVMGIQNLFQSKNVTVAFLALDNEDLIKYDLSNKNITKILSYRPNTEATQHVPSMVKVKDTIYRKFLES